MADFFGDTNPIHRPGTNGVAAVVLPGALIATIAENTIKRARMQQELLQMTLIFLHPVRNDMPQSIDIIDGPQFVHNARPAMRARIRGYCGGKLCYVVECILTLPKENLLLAEF